MKKFIKKIMKKIIVIDKEYISLFFINLFLFMPFISKRFSYGHDIMYHIAQIESITKSFMSSNFTKISSAVINSLGYAPSIFYPKLPHYICTVLNILTGKTSVVYSINLYFVITSFLAGIMMYKLIKLITNNKKASLLGSIFYITMPYYITEVFIRSALNEFLTLTFIPMIFIGLINLIKDNKKNFYIYFIVGYVGFMNSHLVLCVYFTMLLIVFLLINIKKYLKEIKTLIISAGIILVMTLPNLILLIEHKITDLYVVFNQELMGLSVERLHANSINLIDYIIPKNGTVYYFINIAALVFLALGIYYIIKKDNKNKVLYGILGFLVMSIIFSSKLFPYHLLPKLLLSIQFPFRNNCFIIFGVSIIASLGLLLFKDKNKNYLIYPVVLISLIVACFYINKADFRNITQQETEYDIFAILGWTKEYMPIKALKNSEYFFNRDDSIKANDNTSIKELKSNYPSVRFKIENANSKTRIEIPRLYYLGYKVREKVKDKYITLDYKCNKNGFIEIKTPKDGLVEVDWIGTPLYNIFRLIRVLFIMGGTIVLLKKHTKLN